MHPLFVGRTLAIATKHKKELILADKLETRLGVKCTVPKQFDTDVLGTFTGEIERTLSPVEAARQKCKMAMQELGCDLAIASEGSFGAHPAIPFCQANEELLLLIDTHNRLELIASELSTETNFNGTAVINLKQVYDFALATEFPSHRLILRPYQHAHFGIVKDIHTWQYLCKVFTKLMREYGSAYVETDLRAMHNPTRRRVIARALDKLLTLIDSQCPQCEMPGFSEEKVNRGLPCRDCGLPTRAVLSVIKLCKHCGNEEMILYPLGEFENPMYCDRCNP